MVTITSCCAAYYSLLHSADSLTHSFSVESNKINRSTKGKETRALSFLIRCVLLNSAAVTLPMSHRANRPRCFSA